MKSMKIAVFSDTHGSARGMINAVAEYMPDQIIHLGDGMRDTEELEDNFPEIPICHVPGNCDRDFESDDDYKVVRLGPVKAFITHGHRYRVRGGKLDVLLYAAQCCECQIAMFGHTHRAVFDQIGGMFVLNPGSAGSGADRSWAKLEISPDGEISCEICSI